MPSEISQPWTDARRNDPRIVTLSPMTGVQRSGIEPAVETIDACLSEFRTSALPNVFSWSAHGEVPAWDETQFPHSDEELLRINETAVVTADAAIGVLHQRGSAMLGYFLRLALDAPQGMPVVVVAAVDEPISKPLQAICSERPAFTLLRFENTFELAKRLLVWLDRNTVAISHGPARRSDIEAEYQPIAELMRHRWRNSGADARRAVSTTMMLNEPFVRALFEEPLLLASQGHLKLDLACAHLGLDLPQFRLIQIAREVLDADEMDAWLDWGRGHAADYATHVLQFTVDRRVSALIARRDSALTHHGAWDNEARLYTRRRD